MNILSWVSRRFLIVFKLIILILFVGLFILYSRKYVHFDSIQTFNISSTNQKENTIKLFIATTQNTKVKHDSPAFIEFKEENTNTEQNKAVILNSERILHNKKPKPCYNVHTFYYPWYGNPKFDKTYLHWNHDYLPHWNREIAKMYRSGKHQPPDDIGSDFYPALGPYSSHDPVVIKDHMAQISSAGIGVIIVSYYPPGSGDDNGKDWQDVFPMLLDAAQTYKVKVGFHVEPYKNRDENTVKRDLEHIIDTYSTHPAFYKHTHHKRTLPLIYIYDSYHTKPNAWAQILKSDGPDSIRGTLYDAFVIGLFVKDKDGSDLHRAGFDGFYTYFAADGFTYGSTRRKWRELKNFASTNDMLFIPSVGPGYVDTRIRPWNKENTRRRANGKYYEESWTMALNVDTEIISVTSFNEWHEGTQIEKAIPHKFRTYEYENYLPHAPDSYLKMTKKFVEKFNVCKVYNR